MANSHHHTALLVMDMQMGILGHYPDAKRLIAQVKTAIDAARKSNIPVMFVHVGFRPGAPEISKSNKSFSARAGDMGSADKIADWMRIHPDLQPMPEEVVIVKRRVSAFTGSDLEVVLRAQRIEHLVLTGIATSGVVLSTTREAADKDFVLTVLSDCCGDPDEEVHRVLTEKVLPRQADVVAVDGWIATL